MLLLVTVPPDTATPPLIEPELVVLPPVLVKGPDTVTTPLLLKVPSLFTGPLTVRLLVKVPAPVMPTVDCSEPLLTSVPPETFIKMKLLVPDTVKVLAAAWDKDTPARLLAIEIAWPALALFVMPPPP